MKKQNIITIDLSGCKNWNEAQKVIELVSSGKVKIKVKKLWTKNKQKMHW